MYQVLQSWFTVYIYIRHPCYGQLTHVKRRYPLASIHDHITGADLKLIELFFIKLTADQVWVFD